jgi:hypothetical protein
MLYNGNDATNDQFGSSVSISSQTDPDADPAEHIGVGVQRQNAGTHMSFLR